MLDRITFRQRVLALSGCVLFILLFISGFSLFTDKATKEEAQNQVLLSSLLRNSMDADMNHDAIRADVLQAMRAIDAGNTQDLGNVRKEFKEHSDDFLKDIKAIVDKIPSKDLHAEYANVYTALLEYIRFASAVIVAPVQKTELDARYKTFFASFKNMEHLLDKAGTNIEGYEKKGADALASHLNRRAIFVSVFQGLGIAMFLLMAYLILKGVITPINTLEETMTRIAAGDKGLDIPYLDNKAEIGNMAKACERFKQLVLETERLQRDQKDKGREAETNLKQQMLVLTDEIEKEMRETISHVMANAHTVLTISDDMRQSSLRVSAQSEEVSQATQRAQSNVESVAHATGELSISVNEISQQVSHAAVTAQSAVASACETNETVQRLADAVRSVGDVVLLISDIAEQTNLLALNATIEAARAGEAGKGFAVVATEVKNLANQTTKATDSITKQITAIQGATDSAVHAIESIMQTIQEINNTSSSIAAAVEEQGVATSEISSNTKQAAEGTRVVSDKITHVNTEFQRTNELSLRVKETTDEVMKHITNLREHMVEILRNSYAGNRRSSPRYHAPDFNVIATFDGKSYTCSVKDISCEGVALYSKEIGEAALAGSNIGLELSGFTQTITGTVCGIASREIVRLAFKGDDKLFASIARFINARFADNPNALVA